MLKQNNGVTLVALVITIIVLLILAGVSISLVVGDNGVLNQAVNAADNTNEATAKSEIEMAVSVGVTEYLGAKYDGTLASGADLTDYLEPADLERNMATCTIKEATIDLSSGSADVTVVNGSTEYTYTITLSTSGNSATVAPKSGS